MRIALAALLLVACGPPEISSYPTPRTNTPGGQPTESFGTPTPTPTTPPPTTPPPQPPSLCNAGHYTGSLQGNLTVFGYQLLTTGTVDFMLTMRSGDLFDITSGRISGVVMGSPHTSDFSGTLNCATRKLENGLIQNGKVSVDGYGDFFFAGTAQATYDLQSATFTSGVWSANEVSQGGSENFGASATGSWSAHH
jgi:hypothetical protein